jgi:chemotaxis protein histidine kinase CheA
MTISSTTVRNSYSGDGTTDTFTYNFKIFQDSDIQVIIRSANGTETIKTITTHYTVTDAGVASGGTVIFTAGNIPTNTETVVLRRNIPQTQAIDYIANDPFPAESHEEGLDRATMAIQQIQEEVTRSLKLSKTNTMTSTEFTVGAAARANKILAFDASGEISVTQELGTYKGTDATITTEAYVQRDIVKSTSAAQLNNVYICVGDSVVGDLLTDTDHFDLLVDAVSAAASATAAASSATDAETAQTAAETAQTAAETAQTAAELAETNAETAETNAETAETNAAASEAAAAASEANAATSETNAATSESNASTSESNASTSASTATTQAGIATTQAGNASTSASNASTSESNAATSESNAATSASNAATSESNAAASAAAAATAADNFDDVYLGSKASDPTLDNDGDALNAGDLYYNTTSGNLKYYTGSAWVAVTSGGITDLVQDTSPQLGGMLDVNGQAIGDGTLELVKFAETASAVNEITVTNAATTAAPEISATGDDTDIDLKLTPKGAGKLNLDGIKFPNADGTANQILKTDGSGVMLILAILLQQDLQ